jgi:uncharacterized membrane protein YoaK (UPF0700 family)
MASAQSPSQAAVVPKRGPVLLKDADLSEFLFVVSCLCLLAFIGGFVNGMCIAGYFKMGLTHLTGVATNMGTTIGVEQPFRPFSFYFSFIAAFIGGTAIGAIIIDIVSKKKVKEFGFGHSLCFVFESAVLWLLYGILTNCDKPIPGHAWPSAFRFAATLVPFAMGLQAAPTSNLSYGTFRTSMMTGAVAEIGLVIALVAREGHRGHLWRLFNAFVLMFFWIGCIAGSDAWKKYPRDGAAIPAFLMSCVAIVTTFVTYAKWKAEEARERENPKASPAGPAAPCHYGAGTTEGGIIEAMVSIFKGAETEGEGGKSRSKSAATAELDVVATKKEVDLNGDKDFV